MNRHQIRHEHSILVDATPHVAWELASDISRYPQWVGVTLAVKAMWAEMRVGAEDRTRFTVAIGCEVTAGPLTHPLGRPLSHRLGAENARNVERFAALLGSTPLRQVDAARCGGRLAAALRLLRRDVDTQFHAAAKRAGRRSRGSGPSGGCGDWPVWRVWRCSRGSWTRRGQRRSGRCGWFAARCRSPGRGSCGFG